MLPNRNGVIYVNMNMTGSTLVFEKKELLCGLAGDLLFYKQVLKLKSYEKMIQLSKHRNDTFFKLRAIKLTSNKSICLYQFTYCFLNLQTSSLKLAFALRCFESEQVLSIAFFKSRPINLSKNTINRL